jgi:hypothetical protein
VIDVDDCDAVKEKPMITSDSENSGTAKPEAGQPRNRRRPAIKASAPKKAGRTKKAPAKPKADRANNCFSPEHHLSVPYGPDAILISTFTDRAPKNHAQMGV